MIFRPLFDGRPPAAPSAAIPRAVAETEVAP
jgi:hypothetical protein